MRASIILTTVFTALAAAAPIAIDAPTTDISARQTSTVRVQLANSSDAVQAEIPRNQRVRISSKFAGLGGQISADRARVVSKAGICIIYKDAATKNRVVSITAGGAEEKFGGRVLLGDGVIMCQ